MENECNHELECLLEQESEEMHGSRSKDGTGVVHVLRPHYRQAVSPDPAAEHLVVRGARCHLRHASFLHLLDQGR